MKHLKYWKYIIRHKWFVLLAGIKIGAPLWRLLVHDLSKLRPSEWNPYVQYFYGGPFTPWAEVSGYAKYNHFEIELKWCKEQVERRFNQAWLHHQHRNPHHWQYWILREDSGEVLTMEIPGQYLMEMVADWAGAGKAITGRWEVKEWFQKNRHKMQIHPNSMGAIEMLMERFNGAK